LKQGHVVYRTGKDRAKITRAPQNLSLGDTTLKGSRKLHEKRINEKEKRWQVGVKKNRLPKDGARRDVSNSKDNFLRKEHTKWGGGKKTPVKGGF